MKNTTPKISVVIPAHNEGQRVENAIRSFVVGRSSLFPLEFIVVDDASHDKCCNGLEKLFDPGRDQVLVRVITLPRWSGIPFARNRGAAEAAAQILAITDANVEACPGWDIPVFRDLRPQRALCGVIADTASTWRAYGCTLEMPSMGTMWLPQTNVYGGFIPIMPEAATVISAALFRSLGGYDTAMPVYGASEPEFSVRLWLSGAEIVAAPEIIYKHRFRPAAERTPFLNKIEPTLVQNYLRFGMLYLDTPGIVRLMKHYAKNSQPSHFHDALNKLESSDVWQRREHLKQRLKYDFAWYQKRFRIK